MIPGTVHISLGIYLMAEETPGKPQLGDHMMKPVRPVIDSNGVLYLQMMSVESGKEKEGKKERMGSS